MNTENQNPAPAAPVDILGFDAVAACDGGYEFELKGLDGVTGTGVFVTVQGQHSDEVSTWTNTLVNRAMLEQAVAAKSQKMPEPKTMEEIRAQSIEGATIRTTGWRNVQQPYSRELMKKALGRNPHWIDQIVAQSNNLGNFTKKKSAGSLTTPGTNSA